MGRNFGFVDGESRYRLNVACDFVAADNFPFVFVGASHGRLIGERVSGRVQVEGKACAVCIGFRGGG